MCKTVMFISLPYHIPGYAQIHGQFFLQCIVRRCCPSIRVTTEMPYPGNLLYSILDSNSEPVASWRLGAEEQRGH
jgi:hypothetical protein